MKERAGAKVKEVEAEFEISNFVASCATAKTVSEGKSDCREIVSGPILVAGKYKFGIAVAWSVKPETGAVDENNNLGVHVKRLDQEKDECTISLEMAVINKKVGTCLTLTDPTYHAILSGKARGWSRSFEMKDRRRHEGVKGMPLSEVFDVSFGWLHMGALRVSAKINVVIGHEVASSSQTSDAVAGQQEVCESLQALLASGNMADVTIKVGDERIQAHSVILSARSPFFAGMFNSPMRESKDREVNMEDLGAPAMHALLHYMYTGNVQKGVMENDDQCNALLMAAHRCAVPGLTQRCVQALASRLEVETVADRLQRAELIGCPIFKGQCLEFLQTRLPEVQATEGYARLVDQRPALLKDIIEVMHPPTKRRRTKGSKS